MIRILSLLVLVALASCQDHHHLKMAEKLAIPHHIRHAYDYPYINLQRPSAPAAPAQPERPLRGFSQPDPMQFSRPEVSEFVRQPAAPSSFARQQGSQPVRQTRFFNLYTPGSGPNFSLERRQSS
ncbi:hypothetical protein JTE90_020101 [Oedothorax gibbosus]|uniref:Uncharacterized protein n=1 Tax=Oedothorax gibbosus TaxID=931172 RepID=A0AAV6VQ20_9ARAC|nr:hypothetical protein JTE90_020101 [Oedothorax gibbosus]